MSKELRLSLGDRLLGFRGLTSPGAHAGSLAVGRAGLQGKGAGHQGRGRGIGEGAWGIRGKRVRHQGRGQGTKEGGWGTMEGGRASGKWGGAPGKRAGHQENDRCCKGKRKDSAFGAQGCEFSELYIKTILKS